MTSQDLPTLLLLGSALLLVAMAVPLIMGVIGRNRWYGFRTAATLSSDEIWYPANKFMGWGMFWSGLILAALVCAALFRVPGFSLLVVLVYLPLSSVIMLACGFYKLAKLK